MAQVEELIELEPDSKWPLATAIHIGQALAPADEHVAGRTAEWLRTLLRVDPTRANYYKHLLASGSAAVA